MNTNQQTENTKSRDTFVHLAASITHIQLLMMAGGLFVLWFKYAIDWAPDWEWVNEQFGFYRAIVWEITWRSLFVLIPTAFFFPFIRLIATRFVKCERKFEVAVVGLTLCTIAHIIAIMMAWLCDGLIPSRHHQREFGLVALMWPLESIFGIWLFTGLVFQLTSFLISIFHGFFLWGKFKVSQWYLWFYTGVLFYWLIRLAPDRSTLFHDTKFWNLCRIRPQWLALGLVFLPAILTPISIGVAFYRKYRNKQ